MSENWIEKLKEASAAMYQKNINKIVYNRPVTEDGNVTEKSGQYLPKYIFAIKEFYKLSSDAKRLDIKKRPLFVFLSNKSASAEHFFINQSYNFEFVYGNNRKATIPCPKKLKKYISYSANYLYVNYEDNASMEELSIFDKIQFLKAKGKSVFSCSWCNKYFLKAREIFESGKYPNNLNTITDESAAKEMVLEYYNRYFEDELESLLTCKKISEGIDISSVTNIFLFASDRSKLVTTQRIGRALRLDKNNPNKKATIIDFILNETGENDSNADTERAEWLKDLSETRRIEDEKPRPQRRGRKKALGRGDPFDAYAHQIRARPGAKRGTRQPERGDRVQTPAEKEQGGRGPQPRRNAPALDPGESRGLLRNDPPRACLGAPPWRVARTALGRHQL